jgi:transposase
MARRDELAQYFMQPESTSHRRYEVCRAYFLERQTDRQVARRFGLAVSTVRAMVRDFANEDRKRVFFAESPKGRRPRPTMVTARQRIRQLRQQGLAVGTIAERLAGEGCPVSQAHVARLLAAEGFPPLRGRGGPTPPGRQARDGSEAP